MALHPHPTAHPAGWFATRYSCAIILRMVARPSNTRPLILGTLSFAVCFAAWGLIGAFAPRFREMFSLTATQTALLVAVPVLLGSLARLPDGHAHRPLRRTRRLHGPAWLAVAAAGLDGAGSRRAIQALLLGRVLPRPRRLVVRHRRRLRLALDPAGAAGQRARRLRPGQHRPVGGGVSGAACWRRGSAGSRSSSGVAVLLVVWAVAFGLLARNAPADRPAARASARCSACSRASGSPGCSRAFYFLTFGGFVAFSIYLPTPAQGSVRPRRRRTPASAPPGSSCSRPCCARLGGWLSDRIGGARVLAGVFLGVAPVRAAAGLAGDAAVHRRRARLRGAARPRQRRGVQAGAAVLSRARPGTVTGLVGAMGGLGGFFPPLLLGVLPRPHRA